jgi:hypothetical protein
MNKQNSRGGMAVGLVVGLGMLGVLAAVGLMMFGYANNLRHEGVGLETQLAGQYLDNQNELSTFISNFHEQVGIANMKSEKINEILRDAVKGRYESENGNVGYGKGSPLFSAIVEAYPNLNGLDVWDKVGSLVAAGRESYKAKQSKLIDQLRNYDKWRKEWLVRSWVLKNVLGFPSDALEARIGTKVLRGQEALDQMYLIVLASDARKAYETGTLDPLQVPNR